MTRKDYILIADAIHRSLMKMSTTKETKHENV
jgi:hypothetical protein